MRYGPGEAVADGVLAVDRPPHRHVGAGLGILGPQRHRTLVVLTALGGEEVDEELSGVRRAEVRGVDGSEAVASRGRSTS